MSCCGQFVKGLPLEKPNIETESIRSAYNITNSLPEFEICRARAWFSELDSIFFLNGITEDATKYHSVRLELPLSISDKISIFKLATKYETLKDFVIKYSNESSISFNSENGLNASLLNHSTSIDVFAQPVQKCVQKF